jgi:tellurite resistance protein TehA-like permease
MHICIVKIKDPVHSTGFVSLLEGRTDWYKDLMAFLFFFLCLSFFLLLSLWILL